jgi:D-alanyl-lipoteichoic acid acyltransferase DltB (MBOAT superfamily)
MWPEISRLVRPRLAPHRRYFPIPKPPDRRPGLYPGEPETCRRDLGQFLAITAHLGLLLAVFHVYQIEGRAFHLLVTTALVALPVHYLLPYRWKKPCAVAVSIAGLTWVFGSTETALVLLPAFLLIGICYLPIRWRARAIIIGAVAVGLAWLRSSIGRTGLSDIIWPLLGTMFMFRMIVYLYELKHAQRPERLVDTLSYFFLLPNYCFMHFPVVDYKTFLRGYFASDIHEVQRRGLRMMFRGTLHLLAYRLIYHRILIPAEDVNSVLTLAFFLTCNYLLYLHVSGQFHMACGMLHLFGFQLPETHHNYLLATGFTDYWRRINIYWKDFMVRVVFNPVVFRLKHRPQWLALAVGTCAVFLTTWLLHSYQFFWLQGRWAFSAHDALFWGILGVLVLINVQQDARNRQRRPKTIELTPRALSVRALKTAGTFVTIALLWSLWTSPSVGAWLNLLRRAVT